MGDVPENNDDDCENNENALSCHHVVRMTQGLSSAKKGGIISSHAKEESEQRCDYPYRSIATPSQYPLQAVCPPSYPYYGYVDYHPPSYSYFGVPSPAVPSPAVPILPPVPPHAKANEMSSNADNANLVVPAPNHRRTRGRVSKSFPEVLHEMLSTLEREGNGHVASFLSHGRAFAIHDTRDFIAFVMPRFFKQTKLTSFQMQLNLYSFRRISGGGVDDGGYWHPLFLRGRAKLCADIKRSKMRSEKVENPPENDPNFYAYPPIQEEPTESYVTGAPMQVISAPPASLVGPNTYVPWPYYGYAGAPSVPYQYSPFPPYPAAYPNAWHHGNRHMPHTSPVQPLRSDDDVDSVPTGETALSISDTPIHIHWSMKDETGVAHRLSNSTESIVLSCDETSRNATPLSSQQLRRTFE